MTMKKLINSLLSFSIFSKFVNVFTLLVFFLYLFSNSTKAINFANNGDFELSSTTSNSTWFAYGTTHTYSIETVSPISGLYSGKSTIGTVATALTYQSLYVFTTLPKGATYTVSMKVKSSVDFTTAAGGGVQAFLTRSFGDGGTIGTSAITSLTANTVQTITFDVTPFLDAGDGGNVSGVCKLGLYFGKLPVGATILIDDVSVVEKDNLTNLNLCNGDFESVSGNLILAPTGSTYNGISSGGTTKAQTELYDGWSSLRKGTSAAGPYPYTTADIRVLMDYVTPISGLNSILITSTGTPTTVSTDTRFLWMFAGLYSQNYIVTFKAKASVATNTVGVQLGYSTYTGFSEKVLNLTTDVQTFSFSTTSAYNGTGGLNSLQFNFGKLPNGVSVWIDDVQLELKVPVTAVSLTPSSALLAIGAKEQLLGAQPIIILPLWMPMVW